MTMARWEDRPDQRWIALQGDLDHLGCEEVGPRFEEATKSSPATAVVVDLSAVAFIGSRGIGLLLMASKRLAERGRSFAVTGLRPQARRALETLGVFAAIPEYAA